MKIIFILITLFVFNLSFGQQKCNCDKALNDLIKKIENNYPGFAEKTKDTILYNSFKEQLRQEANSNEKSSCFTILKKYTSFFKDGHIWFSPVIALNEKGFDTSEFIDVDMDNFSKDSKSEIDSIEGIWEYSPIDNEGINYKVGIIKTKNDGYTGFAIPTKVNNSKSKRVLFKLTSNEKYESFFPDKAKHTGNFKIYDNTFLYFKPIRRTLMKANKTSKISKKQIKKKIGRIQGFSVKQLSKKTTLITLPSFDYPFVEVINNLIQENRTLIANSGNLIVDIRGNYGGTEGAYKELLPYIMTNSIRYMWVEYLATKEIIDGYEDYLETIKDDKEKIEEVEMCKKEIKLFKENRGQFVNTEDSAIAIQKVIPAKKSPKNVVVLADKRDASAAEDFLIAAKQSKKVKIMGTPTYGAIDYGAVLKFDFGCPEYELSLPSYRSLRLPQYPIDNIGIQPDIYLDKTVTDWVKFAKEYLEN